MKKILLSSIMTVFICSGLLQSSFMNKYSFLNKSPKSILELEGQKERFRLFIKSYFENQIYGIDMYDQKKIGYNYINYLIEVGKKNYNLDKDNAYQIIVEEQENFIKNSALEQNFKKDFMDNFDGTNYTNVLKFLSTAYNLNQPKARQLAEESREEHFNRLQTRKNTNQDVFPSERNQKLMQGFIENRKKIYKGG